MTETTEAAAEAVTPAAPTRDEILKGLDAFAKSAFLDLEARSNQYNEVQGKVEAVTGDPQALLENLRQTSKDPKVLAFNAQIEKANDALLAAEQGRDGILKAQVEKIRKDSEASIEALQTEAAELKTVINAGTGYLAKMSGLDISAVLPKLHGAKTKRKGATGGTGNRRIRGYNVSVNGKKYDGASAAAKDLGVDTGVIQDPFFDKVGDTRPDSVTVTATVKGQSVTITFAKNA